MFNYCRMQRKVDEQSKQKHQQLQILRRLTMMAPLQLLSKYVK